MIKPTVIIPCCGESQRFNGTKKQFLALPNGLPLPIFSGSGITLYQEKVYAFIGEEFIQSKISKWSSWDGKLCLLPIQTESQVHTIRQVIHSMHLYDAPIFIKDCDNYFEAAAFTDSVTVKHTHGTSFKLGNKSYTLLDAERHVKRIEERRQISLYANVGGYGFRSGGLFITFSDGKKYVSEVINSIVASTDIKFAIQGCKNYIDYGEQDDYDKFIKKKF